MMVFFSNVLVVVLDLLLGPSGFFSAPLRLLTGNQSINDYSLFGPFGCVFGVGFFFF